MALASDLGLHCLLRSAVQIISLNMVIWDLPVKIEGPDQTVMHRLKDL